VIIECNDVPEVIRVLRWMGEQPNDLDIKVALRSIPIDLNVSGKPGECSIPARQFMDYVVASEKER
jgi:hypothetical protein